MTKADLVEQVADAIGPGITKKDCALVVDGLLNAMTEAGQLLLRMGGEADERIAQMASRIAGAGDRIEGELVVNEPSTRSTQFTEYVGSIENRGVSARRPRAIETAVLWPL